MTKIPLHENVRIRAIEAGPTYLEEGGDQGPCGGVAQRNLQTETTTKRFKIYRETNQGMTPRNLRVRGGDRKKNQGRGKEVGTNS